MIKPLHRSDPGTDGQRLDRHARPRRPHRAATMTNSNEHRIHLTVVFGDEVLGDLAELRHRFDPAMAVGVAPHLTVVYPEEYDDLETLMERARDLAARTAPFTLTSIACDAASEGGRDWVFLDVHDPTNSWQEMRKQLLAPPFNQLDIGPHITLAHPRTSSLGPNALEEFRSLPRPRPLLVESLSLTRTTPSNERSTLDRLPLTGSGRAVCAGLVPVAGDRVLLGRRLPSGRWYPDTWDVIGGHVEPGETPSATACREAAEELGIGIDPRDLAHLDTLVGPDWELVLFSTRRWTGEPHNAAKDEHSDVGWFGRVDLDSLDFADPGLLQAVGAALPTRQ